MPKQTKITIYIYITTFILVLINIIGSIWFVNKKTHFLTPLANSISIFNNSKQFKANDNIVYGFLPYWGLNEMNNIDLNTVTHIAYFSLHVEKDGSIRKIGADGNIDPGYNQWKNNKELDEFIKKAKQNNVQVALTILSHEADVSDEFLFCEQCWPKLLNDLTLELDSKRIKDINLDFEYASYTEKKYADQYTKLTAYLNENLDKIYGGSFVVVSSFADSIKNPRVSRPQELALVADGIFMMAYDFHVPTSDVVGPIAPIGGVEEQGKSYDITTAVNDYLQYVPAEKLILGVPYYGYNWVVDSYNPNANRLPGNDYIGYSQSQTYKDVIETIINIKPQIQWDEVAMVPYFSYVSPDTGSIRTVYYENARSLSEKYKLIKNYSLGGVGIWALGYDGGYQELWDLLDQEFPN